jgi:uncharacterized glyoxalase superfamily protein PhnB
VREHAPRPEVGGQSVERGHRAAAERDLAPATRCLGAFDHLTGTDRASHVQHAGEGGVEVSEVQDFPWGRFVFFSDPDGNGWAVQQLPPR